MIDERYTHDHHEIDLLLPWYVNQTLDRREHERIARHVATCNACRESVSLLEEVQQTVIRNKSTPIVPQPRVDDLIDAIETKQSNHNFYGQRSWNLIVAFAATVVLVGTLFLINQGGNSRIRQEFETATSTLAGPAMDYVLNIRFEPRVGKSDRDKVLMSIGARDVSRDAAGSYRVIVQLTAESLEDLNVYIDNLVSLPEVESANVIALQLPVKTEQ